MNARLSDPKMVFVLHIHMPLLNLHCGPNRSSRSPFSPGHQSHNFGLVNPCSLETKETDIAVPLNVKYRHHKPIASY